MTRVVTDMNKRTVRNLVVRYELFNKVSNRILKSRQPDHSMGS